LKIPWTPQSWLLDGETVVLDILDEGPGVTLDEQERIFDKFYRSPGNGAPGTGLGLSISRGLVLASGGSVTAAARSDRTGLCVTVSLNAAS
jgi:signal transduction histidine kinase